jgi:hypothetical protein
LPTLQRVVDQFVLHYDVAGTSRTCFRVLHDVRGLSVHFMLDIDGTIYQTLDVKERAWHATVSNDRSVGIEIANIGAYPIGRMPRCWTVVRARGRWGGRHAVITLPKELDGAGCGTPGVFRRRGRSRWREWIQGQELRMYDLTPQQYESLTRLTDDAVHGAAAVSAATTRATALGPIDHATSSAMSSSRRTKGCWVTTTSRRTRQTRARRWTGTRVLIGARSLMR